MRAPTPRERRLLAVLGLIAVVALVQLAIVAPIVNGFVERRAAHEALLMRYAHDARRIAAIPRLRRQAERQRGALSLYSLATPTVDQASERLRDRLQGAVEAAGGTYRTGEDKPAPAGWAGARAEARLTQSQLVAMLAQLQNTPPYLVIEALEIATDETSIVGVAGPLEIRIDVAIPFRLAVAR